MTLRNPEEETLLQKAAGNGPRVPSEEHTALSSCVTPASAPPTAGPRREPEGVLRSQLPGVQQSEGGRERTWVRTEGQPAAQHKGSACEGKCEPGRRCGLMSMLPSRHRGTSHGCPDVNVNDRKMLLTAGQGKSQRPELELSLCPACTARVTEGRLPTSPGPALLQK